MNANNPALEISVYIGLRRIHPYAEMIQITVSLSRIYAQTPILYLMDFFALYADNSQKHEKQTFQCTHKQKIPPQDGLRPAQKLQIWINTYLVSLQFPDHTHYFGVCGLHGSYAESGSFRPRSSSPPRRFAPAAFRPRSFRPWSFRPPSRFAPGRFAPRRKFNIFC